MPAPSNLLTPPISDYWQHTRLLREANARAKRQLAADVLTPASGAELAANPSGMLSADYEATAHPVQVSAEPLPGDDTGALEALTETSHHETDAAVSMPAGMGFGRANNAAARQAAMRSQQQEVLEADRTMQSVPAVPAPGAATLQEPVLPTGPSMAIELPQGHLPMASQCPTISAQAALAPDEPFCGNDEQGQDISKKASVQQASSQGEEGEGRPPLAADVCGTQLVQHFSESSQAASKIVDDSDEGAELLSGAQQAQVRPAILSCILSCKARFLPMCILLSEV